MRTTIDVLSAHGRTDMNHAFTALRGYARSQDLRLSELARAVVEGTADLDAILRHPTRHVPHTRTRDR